jgi:hypothetical protein
MSGTKGLNTTDSVNRVRFANLSQRLSRVNVDVVHRTRAQGSLDLHHSAVPTTGPLGCHFQDELELCKTLDTASHFKRWWIRQWFSNTSSLLTENLTLSVMWIMCSVTNYISEFVFIGVTASNRFYYAIWPLVQSLPELLHHQKEAVTMIESYVQKGQPATLSSFLQLISVLGRYCNIYHLFNNLFSLLQWEITHKISLFYTNIQGSTRGLISSLSSVVWYACQASWCCRVQW